MTIIYDPRGEAHHNIEVTHIKDIIRVTDTINPYEQKQYKSFTFCNMTESERNIVICHLKDKIMQEVGIPQHKVLKGHPEFKEIYLPSIGKITLL